MLNIANLDNQFHFEAISEKKNQYDIVYFGKIRCKNYNTYGYFTKSQLSFIKKHIKLTKTNKKIIIRNPHYKEEQAINEKYYFNTYIMMAGLKYLNTYSDSYFREHEVRKYKSNKFLNWYISDRKEVIFQEKVDQSIIKIGHNLNINLRDSEIQLLNQFKNYTDFKNFFSIPFKEFDTFFESNKLYVQDQYNQIQINRIFLRSIVFLDKFIKQSNIQHEIKSWTIYHDLLTHIMNNHNAYMNSLFLDDSKYFDRFFECFKIIAPKKPIQKLKKWKFYFSNIKEMKENIQKINQEYQIQWDKFEDPIYCYNFYCKKLNEDSIENFLLPNNNINEWTNEKYNNHLDHIKLDELNIKVLSTKDELIKVGSWLHNCAGGIDQNEYYKECISFSVYDENYLNPVYLGTIRNGFLTQLKGFKNSSPPFSLFEKLMQELFNNNIIDKHCFKNLNDSDFYIKCCVQKYS